MTKFNTSEEYTTAQGHDTQDLAAGKHYVTGEYFSPVDDEWKQVVWNHEGKNGRLFSSPTTKVSDLVLCRASVPATATDVGAVPRAIAADGSTTETSVTHSTLDDGRRVTVSTTVTVSA